MQFANNKDTTKPPMKKVLATKFDKEWVQDTKGYFLIDTRIDEQLMYAHFYSSDKTYQLSVVGETAEDVYYTIIRKELVSSLQHAAYLGAELYKAQLCMQEHKKYVQDEDCE
jgi:tetrahydromethanopterin S-methyltransferase subunit A